MALRTASMDRSRLPGYQTFPMLPFGRPEDSLPVVSYTWCQWYGSILFEFLCDLPERKRISARNARNTSTTNSPLEVRI